jgi:hypothetical protein
MSGCDSINHGYHWKNYREGPDRMTRKVEA